MSKDINSKTIEHLHGLYMCGMSLAKLSENYCPEISRQRLHYYFKMYRLPTRPKKVGEVRVYKGTRYGVSKGGYWRGTSGDREFLHRRVWRECGNLVPEGYVVIFKDRNTDNTSIGNLECVSKSSFGERSVTGRNQYTK